MNLETAARFINADATLVSPALVSEKVTGFSIDSRTVAEGELFFALAQPDYQNNGFNGDFADAHEFVPAAFERGAVAAVVRVDKLAEHDFLKPFLNRLLIVEDGIAALQRLAAGVYREWNKPVVAVTGSAGKTTAKEMTAQILAASGKRVLSNIKNYNNGLGHPLTVLRLVNEGEFDAAVLEMGMSTPLREIERLCKITPPDVAIELNVLPVHLEHLGTIEAIQQAKAELVKNMKPSGTAILNADDFRVAAMRDAAKGSRVLSYGIDNQADVTATNIQSIRFGETRFVLNTPSGSANVQLQLVGKHNVSNALAAAGAGLCFEMTADEIAAALGAVEPPPMRGEVLRFENTGVEVVNDSYNSNPDALLSMVQTIIENGAHARRKVVVAGEMLELGDEAANIHFETGRKIAKMGIDALYGVRGLAKNLIEGAKENGLQDVLFFNDSDEAADAIGSLVRTGDLVLVKGSRGVRTEKIVERLKKISVSKIFANKLNFLAFAIEHLKNYLTCQANAVSPLYQFIFESFKGSESYFVKLLNVFQYVTFRTAYSTITALLLCLLFGRPIINWLRRLKFGQEIRAEGPASHQEKKGTPTMGGILILGSVLISTLLWARLDALYVWLAILATGIFGLVGFLDDYIKIVKKRSLGLTGKQKLLGQLIAALIVWTALYLSGEYSWNIAIPFFKDTAQTGITAISPFIYLVFIIIVLLGSSNAVNLTDGLDGLAISVTFIAMTALTALTYVSSDGRWANYLDIVHKPQAAELTVFCGAMVGASLGFLWFNAPPAEVFMGDVGSLAIGGAIGTIAILTKNELMLVIVGGVFVIEAISVMLQVSVFKITKQWKGKGERVFAMAPLHHHFEVSDKHRWKESKIVFRFLIVAILFALLSLSTLKLR